MTSGKKREYATWVMAVLILACWGCGEAKKSKDAALKMLEKGFAQQEKGNHVRAMEIYSQVLKKNPQLSTGYVYRAMLYETMGKNEAAIADFQKVIELDPTDFYCAQQIANIYRKMGDEPNAKEAEQQAQKIQQNAMEQTRKNLNKGKKSNSESKK